MIVVDSSVWIDFFRGTPTAEVEALDALLWAGETPLVVPDLVLFEVLRGFRHEGDHRRARQLLEGLDVMAASSPELALEAAQHDRSLRAHGVTVRSPIDVLLAAFCIEHDFTLLHRDRDFDAFERHRGLRVFQPTTPAS